MKVVGNNRTDLTDIRYGFDFRDQISEKKAKRMAKLACRLIDKKSSNALSNSIVMGKIDPNNTTVQSKITEQFFKNISKISRRSLKLDDKYPSYLLTSIGKEIEKLEKSGVNILPIMRDQRTIDHIAMTINRIGDNLNAYSFNYRKFLLDPATTQVALDILRDESVAKYAKRRLRSSFFNIRPNSGNPVGEIASYLMVKTMQSDFLDQDDLVNFDSGNRAERNGFLKAVNLMEQLGYIPLNSKEEKIALMSPNQISKHKGVIIRQNNLYQLNIIQRKMVDKLYHVKLQFLKDWLNTNKAKKALIPNLIIKPDLQPSGMDDMADYWFKIGLRSSRLDPMTFLAEQMFLAKVGAEPISARLINKKGLPLIDLAAKLKELDDNFARLSYHLGGVSFRDVPFVNSYLLRPAVIDSLGWGRIGQIIQLNNGVYDLIGHMNKADLVRLNRHFIAVEKTGIYKNEAGRLVSLVLHKEAIFADLFDSLSKNELTPKQLTNLKTLLEFNATTKIDRVDQLDDYMNKLGLKLHRQLRSKNINKVRDAIDDILQPLYLGVSVFAGSDIIDTNTAKNAKLSADDWRLLNRVDSLRKASKDNNLDALLANFHLIERIVGGNATMALANVLKKIEDYVNFDFKTELIDLDDINLKHKMIDDTTGQSKLDVILLEKEKFKILTHTINSEPSEMVGGVGARAINFWNKGLESSTIKTSLISNTRFCNYLRSSDEASSIYLGFSVLHDNAVVATSSEGRSVSTCKINSGRTIEYASPLMDTDTLINKSAKLSYPTRNVLLYNQVVLKRYYKGKNNRRQRLAPSCVLVHGSSTSSINGESKMMAEYFNLPIVLVNDRAYRRQRDGIKI